MGMFNDLMNKIFRHAPAADANPAVPVSTVSTNAKLDLEALEKVAADLLEH